MSQNLKNVLYLALIIVLFVAIPFFIPQTGFIFNTLPLIYAVLTFCATQFAKNTYLTSIITSGASLIYLMIYAKFLAPMIGAGIGYFILLVLVCGIVFSVKYFTSHNTQESITLTLKSAGWLIVALLMNIVLTMATVFVVVLIKA